MKCLTVASAAMVLALLTGTSTSRGSDVFSSCRDCRVNSSDRGALAQLLRSSDLAFEGTYLGFDRVAAGYERGCMLARFRITQLLRGIAPSDTIAIMQIGGLPEIGTTALVWVLRDCTIDNHPCGGFVTVTPERTMRFLDVDSDWRQGLSLLPCDSLETDVVQLPDSTGLHDFEHVSAVGVAELACGDTVGINCRLSSGFPENGGIWPMEGIRWVVGRSDDVPHFVYFPRYRQYWGGGVHRGDRFLIPMSAGLGDTLFVRPSWRSMLVRNGEAAAFGVPADSLARLYVRDSTGYRLTVQSATPPR